MVEAKEATAKLYYKIEVRTKTDIKRYPNAGQLFTATSKIPGEAELTGPVFGNKNGVMTGSVTLTEENTFWGDIAPLQVLSTALCSGTATNMRDGQLHKGKKGKQFLFRWGACPGVDSGMLRKIYLPEGAYSLLTKFTPGAEHTETLVVAHAKKTAGSPSALEPDVKIGEFFM